MPEQPILALPTVTRRAQTLLALVAALCFCAALAEPVSEQDIEVQVDFAGDVVRIDVSFHV